MASEGDWIYTLDEELHERLRNDILSALSHEEVCRMLIALSLSRIALNLEALLLSNNDEALPVCIKGQVRVDTGA
jgi:hypothetical protein